MLAHRTLQNSGFTGLSQLNQSFKGVASTIKPGSLSTSWRQRATRLQLSLVEPKCRKAGCDMGFEEYDHTIVVLWLLHTMPYIRFPSILNPKKRIVPLSARPSQTLNPGPCLYVVYGLLHITKIRLISET